METSIVLFGIGGYGDVYVRALTQQKARKNCVIAGVIDPFAAAARGYETLREMGVEFFSAPEEFYATHTADLAIISTPIPLHESQAIYAMEHGSHVLLEKPISATPEAGRRIAAAAERTGKKLAIGFQWCYDEAMLRLKADVDSGILGAPKRLRTLVLWPRDLAYYSRGTGWAGKKHDRAGNPIFDSVASNATAHYLENMLWLAGNGFNGAPIADMKVETWRANDIETFDTVTLIGTLDNGAEITYVVSHAIHPDALQNPMFEYEFENATAYFGGYGVDGASLTARFRDGSVKDYGVSDNGSMGYTAKLWNMIDAIREGAPIACPAAAALCHADAIAKMREIEPDSRVFKNIRRTESFVWTPGLDKALIRCYEERRLLSEVMEEEA